MAAGGGIKINNISVRGGADGKTPVFKVEGGYLYNSYNNGVTWNKLGEALKGAQGDKGADGKDAAKLVSQVLQGKDTNGGNIYLQTYDDGTTFLFTAPKGDTGAQGPKGEKGDTGEARQNIVITLPESGGSLSDEIIAFLKKADNETYFVKYKNEYYHFLLKTTSKGLACSPCVIFSCVSVGAVDPTGVKIKNIVFYDLNEDQSYWSYSVNENLPLWVNLKDSDFYYSLSYAMDTSMFKRKAARIDFNSIAQHSAESDIRYPGTYFYPYAYIQAFGGDLSQFPESDTTNSYIVTATERYIPDSNTGNFIQLYICYSTSGKTYIKYGQFVSDNQQKETAWVCLNDDTATVNKAVDSIQQWMQKNGVSIGIYNEVVFDKDIQFPSGLNSIKWLWNDAELGMDGYYFDADYQGNRDLTFAFPKSPPDSENCVLVSKFDTKGNYNKDEWVDIDELVDVESVKEYANDLVNKAKAEIQSRSDIVYLKTEHNTNTDAHNDIRLKVEEIRDRLNAFLDVDDKTLDQLNEVIAYINSNKSLIDSITTSKVSVSDIVDNLVTSVTNKPLSAAQGVVLKSLIDNVDKPIYVDITRTPYDTIGYQFANDADFTAILNSDKPQQYVLRETKTNTNGDKYYSYYAVLGNAYNRKVFAVGNGEEPQIIVFDSATGWSKNYPLVDTIRKGEGIGAERFNLGYKNGTTAKGDYSHAEGSYTIANGYASHAEGAYTEAYSYASHAEGAYTEIPSGMAYNGAHAEGSYNDPTPYKELYPAISTVGIGTPSKRKNGLVVRTNGSVQGGMNTIEFKAFLDLLDGAKDYWEETIEKTFVPYGWVSEQLQEINDYLDEVKSNSLVNYLEQTSGFTFDNNCMYVIQSYDSSGNLASFTLTKYDKTTIATEGALVLTGKVREDPWQELVIYQTSALKGYAKSTNAVVSVAPSSGNRLVYFKISGNAIFKNIIEQDVKAIIADEINEVNDKIDSEILRVDTNVALLRSDITSEVNSAFEQHKDDLKASVFCKNISTTTTNITLYRHNVYIISSDTSNTDTEINFSFISYDSSPCTTASFGNSLKNHLSSEILQPAYGYIKDTTISSKGAQVIGIETDGVTIYFRCIYYANGVLTKKDYVGTLSELKLAVSYDEVTAIEKPTTIL